MKKIDEKNQKNMLSLYEGIKISSSNANSTHSRVKYENENKNVENVIVLLCMHMCVML
jgi:hypothetical protein